ncbi:TPA: hypothetical protein P0E26_005029 [Vibrio harveyi]|uniref:hypothetical protein n=1 Tax=Vibrio alfacsensis TaxID=1074311 RepID=UPI0006826704|nr:hypothetical protein [Vibrio alfacsensis]BBM64924.1 hypothetical protein VA249_15700 [Vibrio alfacsensis]BBM64937.1 hypothetical protein VA249_15830 [Vibrio alfacsensis]HDM8188278.1 hypothetical protein [Vibrio harveyi]
MFDFIKELLQDPIFTGVFGVLVGGLLGHRFALGRDKRKEYNEVIIPVREALIDQLYKLNDDIFDSGIDETHLLRLQANLNVQKFKRIETQYDNYQELRDKAGERDMYGQFTKNDEYFELYKKSAETLLNELHLK